MKPFFIDTADCEYVKKAWDKLLTVFHKRELIGVTTNPNAFAKIGANSLIQWEKTVHELAELVTDITGKGGIIYVQTPSSMMTPDQVVRWAKLISTFGDGRTIIGIKIPPFAPILSIAEELDGIASVNVTGIADCATALMALTYHGVRYVSVITGRMEEQGIDAKSHLEFIRQRGFEVEGDVIAGSMRTIEQVKWAIEYGAIPTIGTKVMDKLLHNVKDFATYWDKPDLISLPFLRFAPSIASIQTVLSEDFFTQMDKCGAEVENDFLAKGKV